MNPRLLYILLFLSSNLLAQPIDTNGIQITIETDTVDTVRYVEVFSDHSPLENNFSNWLKVDFSNLFPRFVTPVDELPFGMSLTFEQKLNDRFSINIAAGLYKDRFVLSSPQESDYTPMALFGAIEPRYYFPPPKGSPKTPFATFYLGARYQADYRAKYWYNFRVDNPQNSLLHNFSILAGMQSQFPGKGFFDIAAGLRFWMGTKPLPYLDAQDSLRHRSGFASGIGALYRLNIGFGFFKNTAKEQAARSVLFGFQRNERSMLKINLLDLFKTVEYSALYNKYSIRPDFEFEQKIITPLSILAGVSADITFYSLKKQNADIKGIPAKRPGLSLQSEISARWYFNLYKRMATGKSADNLSADYITLIGTHQYNRSTDNTNPDQYLTTSGYSASAAYGIQRRIFKNGYFDYRLGLGTRLNPVPGQDSVFILSDLQVGFAF